MRNRPQMYWPTGIAGICLAIAGCDAMTEQQNPPTMTDTPGVEMIESEEGSVTRPMDRETDVVADRLEKIENDPDTKITPAPSQVEFEGVITEIQPTAVKIRYGEQPENKFALAEDVEIVRNGAGDEAALTLETLQVGQQVVLITQRTDDQNGGVIQVVKTIQIIPAPLPPETPQPTPAPEAEPAAPAPESATPEPPAPEPTPAPAVESTD